MAEYMVDLDGMGIEDAEEIKAAPDGEYEVEIVDWKTDDEGHVIQENASGGRYIMPVIEIVNHENADMFSDFSHYVGLPDPAAKDKRAAKQRWRTKQFFQAFGIQLSGTWDPQDSIGNRTYAILETEENAQFGNRNVIARFVGGR